MRAQISSRSWRLLCASLLAAVVTTYPSAPRAADEGTVVMAQFGGVWQEALEKVLAPFEAERNVKIRYVSGSSMASTARAIAARNNQDVDVVLGEELSHALGRKEQIWEKLDPAIVTHLNDVVKPSRLPGDQGVGFIMQSVGMFYMTDVFEKNKWDPPTSWTALLDKKYCHRIGISHPNVSFAYYALMMLGGGEPADFLAGAKRLATNKECIDTMDTSAQKTLQKVQLGEFDIGVMNHPLILTKAKAGVPVKFFKPKEGSILQFTTAAVARGAPHAKLAQELVNELLSPRVQRALVEQFSVSPVNINVEAKPELIEVGAPDPKNLEGYVGIKADEIVANRKDFIQEAIRILGE